MRKTLQIKAMKTKLEKATLFTVFLTLTGITMSAPAPAEEEAIRKLETQQQEAWNKHDARAYASLFTETGDCVNVAGWWWKGRREIEQKLTAAYAFVFRESVLTITDVDVTFPASDVAIAHVRWSMVGARTPSGYPKVQQGIQTQTLLKSNGNWLIAAFQNTNAIPETPFPQGPPASSAQSPVTP
jgi:uncharacterized protein (TIGR02246 family)